MDSLRITRHFFFILTLFTSLLAWQGTVHAAEGDDMSAQTVATVNVNTASAQELSSTLTGVGEKKAQAIISYREEHGPFEDLADLQNVKGIGESLAEKNASRIVF